MISIFLLAVSLISLPISIAVIFIGKRILNIYPSVRKLYQEEHIFKQIKLSRNAINADGESLYSFATKTILAEHVIDIKKYKRVNYLFDHFKIGQVLTLTYYYQDQKLDRDFKSFKPVCQFLVVMSMIVFLNACNVSLDTADFNKTIKAFDNDYVKLFSLAQSLTFLTLLIRLVSEANKIDRLFDNRS